MSDSRLHELRNELHALRLGLPTYAALIERGRDDDARVAMDEMLRAVDRIEALALQTGGDRGAPA